MKNEITVNSKTQDVINNFISFFKRNGRHCVQDGHMLLVSIEEYSGNNVDVMLYSPIFFTTKNSIAFYKHTHSSIVKLIEEKMI